MFYSVAITLKGTPMAARIPPSIDREADRLEAALKSANIPDLLHDGFWSIWVNNPPRAHALIARFKDNGATPSLKATAPGMVSVQMTREEADAWQAAIANEGNKRIIALLRQVTGTQIAVSAGGKLTDSGDGSKPVATKQVPLDPWQNPDFSDMTPR
jgi:hypothetical protein